jgi:hypothetical protein
MANVKKKEKNGVSLVLSRKKTIFANEKVDGENIPSFSPI